MHLWYAVFEGCCGILCLASCSSSVGVKIMASPVHHPGNQPVSGNTLDMHVPGTDRTVCIAGPIE